MLPTDSKNSTISPQSKIEDCSSVVHAMKPSLFALCCLLLSNGFVRAPALPMAETELDMGIPATAPVVDKKPVPLPRRADVFRKEFALKLCKGRAERKDYDDCRKGIETLERPPFCLHLAEYYRIIDRNSA